MNQQTALAERNDIDAARKVLLFAVGPETYGMDIARIKEIIEYSGVTKVPLTPAHIRGVVNLRGNVVPVVDLAVRLGKTASEVGRRTCIVVLEVPYAEELLDIGMVVDAVNEVMDVADRDVQPAPSFGASVREDFIGGMGKAGDRFVIILNQDTTLSVDELAQFADVVKAS